MSAHRAQFWPRATSVFGAATLLVLVGFSFLPDVRAAYPDGDFGPALSAFQRAETMAELRALFGEPADPAKLAAMSAGNALDLYAFIPAYTLCLIAGAAMLAGGLRRPLAWLAIAPALVGASADVVETWTQLRMSADWTRAEALLPIVAPACWTKYFGVAFSALGVSAICFLAPPRRWILAVTGFIPIIGVFADWAGLAHFSSLMSMVFGVFWISLLIAALADAVRRPPTAQAKGASH